MAELVTPDLSVTYFGARPAFCEGSHSLDFLRSIQVYNIVFVTLLHFHFKKKEDNLIPGGVSTCSENRKTQKNDKKKTTNKLANDCSQHRLTHLPHCQGVFLPHRSKATPKTRRLPEAGSCQACRLGVGGSKKKLSAKFSLLFFHRNAEETTRGASLFSAMLNSFMA